MQMLLLMLYILLGPHFHTGQGCTRVDASIVAIVRVLEISRSYPACQSPRHGASPNNTSRCKAEVEMDLWALSSTALRGLFPRSVHWSTCAMHGPCELIVYLEWPDQIRSTLTFRQRTQRKSGDTGHHSCLMCGFLSPPGRSRRFVVPHRLHTST